MSVILICLVALRDVRRPGSSYLLINLIYLVNALLKLSPDLIKNARTSSLLVAPV